MSLPFSTGVNHSRPKAKTVKMILTILATIRTSKRRSNTKNPINKKLSTMKEKKREDRQKRKIGRMKVRLKSGRRITLRGQMAGLSLSMILKTCKSIDSVTTRQRRMRI